MDKNSSADIHESKYTTHYLYLAANMLQLDSRAAACAARKGEIGHTAVSIAKGINLVAARQKHVALKIEVTGVFCSVP